MSLEDLSPAIPPDFDGVVRLFPLPNVVLFPHVVLPLHIFEPRYCDMLEEALETDRLIMMTLLLPGWEKETKKRPEISPLGCLGKIISHTRLPEGRHNIMLAGLRRAAINRELPLKRPFRRAKVQLVEDFYDPSHVQKLPALQRQLLDMFRNFVPQTSLAQEQLEQLLAQQISLGMLTDIVSFTVGLPINTKQQLLGEWRVDRRAELLLKTLEKMHQPESNDGDAPRSFPPSFSVN